MTQSIEGTTSSESIAALADAAGSALASQDWQAAADAYERLVELQPKNSDHRFNLAQAYDELGRLQDALRVLEAPAIAHLDKTKRRLARTYIDLKDYAAAIPLVDELIAAHPENPKFAKWKTVLDEKSGPDQLAAERMQRGQQLFEEGRIAEAEQIYLQLLNDYPGFARASLYLGKIYAEQKRWDEAIPPLRDGLATDPGNTKLRDTLARALFKSGDIDAAIEVLEANGGPGEDVDGLFLLQRSHFELHHWQLVEETADRLLNLLPATDELAESVAELRDEGQLRRELEKVDALWADGRSDEALVEQRRVADRYSGRPLAWLALGSALMRDGRHAEAAAGLSDAVSVHPDDLEIRTALSRAIIKSGDGEQVLAHARKAVASGRGDFEACRWLARYHADRGEWPQTLENAQCALEFDPTSSSARVMLVRSLINLGRLNDALVEADALLATGEKQAEALQLKGDILLGLSQVDAAITHYCQALGRSRRHPLATANLETALLEGQIDPYPVRELSDLPLKIDDTAIDRAMRPFLGSVDDFGWKRRERKVWRRAVDRIAAGQQATRDRDLIEQEYAVWATMGFDRYRLDRGDITGSPWSWRGQNLFLDGAAAARLRAVLFAAVLAELKPRRVLEVGSGNGINLLTLAGAFPDTEFTGLELTHEGVDEARRAQRDKRIADIIHDYSPANILDPTAIERINFVQGDASKLPFEQDSFDLVMTVLAVEQMESIRSAALSEIARVSSGHVLMLEPFRDRNQEALKALYVRSRGYFRGSIAGLRDFGLEPLWATHDFPQETFLGTALVLAQKQ